MRACFCACLLHGTSGGFFFGLNPGYHNSFSKLCQNVSRDISVTSDKYSAEAQNLELPESTTTKTLLETPLHHVHSISLALLKLIIHKIDLESVCFPHVAQKLDVPLVVLRTSLYKPRCLASIHTSLIS